MISLWMKEIRNYIFASFKSISCENILQTHFGLKSMDGNLKDKKNCLHKKNERKHWTEPTVMPQRKSPDISFHDCISCSFCHFTRFLKTRKKTHSNHFLKYSSALFLTREPITTSKSNDFCSEKMCLWMPSFPFYFRCQ